jgi:TPR repeat protein
MRILGQRAKPGPARPRAHQRGCHGQGRDRDRGRTARRAFGPPDLRGILPVGVQPRPHRPGEPMGLGNMRARRAPRYRSRPATVAACTNIGAIMATIVVAGTTVAGQIEDCAAAMRTLQPQADKGNAEAQFTLGLRYANGLCVPKDYGAAVKWYRLAAGQGHAQRRYNLASGYENGGQGVPQDYTAALRW